MFAGVSKRSWQKAREHQNKAALYGRRTADGGCPYIVLQEFRMSEALADKKCVPCRGGVPPLKGEELKKLHDSIPEWEVVSEHHLHREFRFPDFKQALDFVNRVGAIAEQEGHHPDILLAWGKVGITSWTHTIDGLTESDFILAAKIERLAK
jgi:4a-hydroxytetrahydrobiopterin dehydratase